MFCYGAKSVVLRMCSSVTKKIPIFISYVPWHYITFNCHSMVFFFTEHVLAVQCNAIICIGLVLKIYVSVLIHTTSLKRSSKLSKKQKNKQTKTLAYCSYLYLYSFRTRYLFNSNNVFLFGYILLCPWHVQHILHENLTTEAVLSFQIVASCGLST